MPDKQKKTEQASSGGEGFTAADFAGQTSRLTEAQRKIEAEKIALYNVDSADARTRWRKLDVLSKLFGYFSRED